MIELQQIEASDDWGSVLNPIYYHNPTFLKLQLLIFSSNSASTLFFLAGCFWGYRVGNIRKDPSHCELGDAWLWG